MADFCKFCNKKIWFFSGDYSVQGVKICEDCYYSYKYVLDSVSDWGNFEENLKEFESKFYGKEGLSVILDHLKNLHKLELQKTEEKRIENERMGNETSEPVGQAVNDNIGPFENQDLVYTIDGVRGRHIDIYKDKVIITTKVTIGSLLTNNATDGEKTIYYLDCIGVQFKQSKFAIGYLQLETASSNGNNKHSNFWAENSFTFDTTVISNERMVEVANFVKSRIDAVKNSKHTYSQTNSNISVADELLKLKQLLDMEVLTQEEFEMKKKQLLEL